LQKLIREQLGKSSDTLPVDEKPITTETTSVQPAPTTVHPVKHPADGDENK
jgi:hypothetical protein